MNTATIEMVGQAVDYIEKQLKGPLLLDDLARGLHLSKYYLHRLFKSITGNTLMAYVTGRKLTSSLQELLMTDMNIIDIACEYGFEYEQSYERAFRRLFGVTPAAFRKTRCEVPAVARIDTNLMTDFAQGILLAPAFRMRPQFYLTGISELIVHRDNYKRLTANTIGHDFMINYLDQVPNAGKKHVYYGFCEYTETPYVCNYYIPSIECTAPYTGEKPLVGVTVPDSLYAVFRYVGFHAPEELNFRTLLDIYVYISYTWLPKTHYRQANPYHFERMDLKLCTSAYCEADIYIPIVK